MSDVVKCPVCNGSGKIHIDRYGRLDTSIEARRKKKCHGCNGKGWVVT